MVIAIKSLMLLQVTSYKWPAYQVVQRQLHASCGLKAAENVSLLEERILNTVPKVRF